MSVRLAEINICTKDLRYFDVPVLGVMAPPTGLRFHPHLQCSSVQVRVDAQRKNPLAVFSGENLNVFSIEATVLPPAFFVPNKLSPIYPLAIARLTRQESLAQLVRVYPAIGFYLLD